MSIVYRIVTRDDAVRNFRVGGIDSNRAIPKSRVSHLRCDTGALRLGLLINDA